MICHPARDLDKIGERQDLPDVVDGETGRASGSGIAVVSLLARDYQSLVLSCDGPEHVDQPG